MVAIGRVLHPHGLEGEVLFEPFLLELACYQGLSEVAVAWGEGQFRRYRITHLRQSGGRLLLRFEGCSSRDMAQLLMGREVYVRRDELPPPPVGEFYWFDLEGLGVYTEGGEYLGQVAEFFPTGSNEVLVVRKGQQEVLLPFIKDVVIAVDYEHKTMHVRLVPGLL